MKDNYKIVLTSSPVFSNNMGCNALTYGSLCLLEEVAKRLGVNFQYILCGNDVKGVVPHELCSLDIVLHPAARGVNIKSLLTWAFRRQVRQGLSEISTLKEGDVFIDIAGGDSFSDIYGVKRFNSIYLAQNIALKLGKPLVLFPQTVGPFSEDSIHKKAEGVLNRASFVYTRDPLSTGCVSEVGNDVDVFETIDVAMFMQYTAAEKVTGKSRIGINPSGLLWNLGCTNANKFKLKNDYKKTIRTIVETLLDQGHEVVLIGHDIHGPSSGGSYDDYYVCKELARAYPNCIIAPFFYSPVEAKSFVSGLDGLIGARMHCCIAAYSSGVPVLPLAYSRKFRGLFSKKLDYPYVCELVDRNCDQVQNDVLDFIKAIPEIKSGMKNRLERLSGFKEEVVSNMTELFRGLLK